MKRKIISITKKIPVPVVLPDGFYNGVYGGDIIAINYEGEDYELIAAEGIRGFNFKVVVEIKDGNMSFEVLQQ